MKYHNQRCPSCASTDVADILYGPLEEKDYEEEVRQKRVFFGGKIIREEGPHLLCNECRKAWCRTNEDLYYLDELGEFTLLK